MRFSAYHPIGRNYTYLIVLLLGMVINSTVVIAQPNPEPAADADLELNGLVIDETISKLGRDFYDLFYNRWDAPNSSEHYTVHIKEQLQPGRGTRISVLLNDNEIMNQVLQPRQEILLALANRAIQLVRYQILNYQQMARQLENEDQYGSGIF